MKFTQTSKLGKWQLFDSAVRVRPQPPIDRGRPGKPMGQLPEPSVKSSGK
jgi:hypothetical protein